MEEVAPDVARTSAVLKARLQNHLNDVCVMTPAASCKGWRCRVESSTSCTAVQVFALVYIPYIIHFIITV